MARLKSSSSIVPLDHVCRTILLLRGQRVILDADLARLYGVTTARLKQQVRRNMDRFPDDFTFQLSWDEARSLRMQFATLDESREELAPQPATSQRGRHTKFRPIAFTEHGAIMAASVLNSKEAVKASLFVVRAFVQLRELLSTHRELSEKLKELERKLQNHDDRINKHDGHIKSVIDAIRQLLKPPDDPPKPPFGFHPRLSPRDATTKPTARLPKTSPRTR